MLPGSRVRHRTGAEQATLLAEHPWAAEMVSYLQVPVAEVPLRFLLRKRHGFQKVASILEALCPVKAGSLLLSLSRNQDQDQDQDKFAASTEDAEKELEANLKAKMEKEIEKEIEEHMEVDLEASGSSIGSLVLEHMEAPVLLTPLTNSNPNPNPNWDGGGECSFDLETSFLSGGC